MPGERIAPRPAPAAATPAVPTAATPPVAPTTPIEPTTTPVAGAPGAQVAAAVNGGRPVLHNGHQAQGQAQQGQASTNGCTAPQLRRFIKSRPYVPMHELRRRFAINGADDDVTPVRVDTHTLFIGLPAREGALLGELLRAGDVGYELSLDPRTPVVIGVYPMRPVARG